MSLDRLDRILAARGYCSRSQAPELLRQREITLDGRRFPDPSIRVPRASLLLIDGEPIDPPRLVILLNKPIGLTCSRDEPGPIIYDLFPARWSRRRPSFTSAGRLDKATSGALILTDDGQLVHRLTAPRRHLPKTYRVALSRSLSGREPSLFASGRFCLADDVKPLLPASLDVLAPKHVRLTIVEGRYHQIRRMFATLGNEVVSLHRESIGPITLDTLEIGCWRHLTPKDLDLLTTT